MGYGELPLQGVATWRSRSRSMRVDRDFFVSGVRSVSLRKTDLTPCAAVSTKVDIHQSMQRGTVEGGVGPVAGVVRGMDAAATPLERVYGVSSQSDPPRHPTLCQLLPLPLFRQVQGCKPCRTHTPSHHRDAVLPQVPVRRRGHDHLRQRIRQLALAITVPSAPCSSRCFTSASLCARGQQGQVRIDRPQHGQRLTGFQRLRKSPAPAPRSWRAPDGPRQPRSAGGTAADRRQALGMCLLDVFLVVIDHQHRHATVGSTCASSLPTRP